MILFSRYDRASTHKTYMLVTSQNTAIIMFFPHLFLTSPLFIPYFYLKILYSLSTCLLSFSCLTSYFLLPSHSLRLFLFLLLRISLLFEIIEKSIRLWNEFCLLIILNTNHLTSNTKWWNWNKSSKTLLHVMHQWRRNCRSSKENCWKCCTKNDLHSHFFPWFDIIDSRDSVSFSNQLVQKNTSVSLLTNSTHRKTLQSPSLQRVCIDKHFSFPRYKEYA
jgi:hypothetical protein